MANKEKNTSTIIERNEILKVDIPIERISNMRINKKIINSMKKYFFTDLTSAQLKKVSE